MESEDRMTNDPKRLPQTVAELLERIDQERGPLEQAATDLDDDALMATDGGWSAKDHLAHVAAWERRLVGELLGDPAAARLGIDEATFDAADTDTINSVLSARYQDHSPAMIRDEFQASGEALRSVIAGLSDTDLTRSVRPNDPAVDTLVELIAWDTFKHYPEHVAAIGTQT